VVKCSEVLQRSDVSFGSFLFLSLCVWLYILCAFVSFCKLYIPIVMFMYYCYVCSVLLLLCMLCCVYSVFIPDTLTEVFPCFSLSCKANARVYPSKTGHGLHSF
jgi:hypothetical protein